MMFLHYFSVTTAKVQSKIGVCVIHRRTSYTGKYGNDKKIIKCSECGLTQLKSKCRNKIMASILTITGKDTLSLNILDDTTKQLYNIKTE